MSKLSQPLKQLISASHARPNTLPAPKNIKSVFQKIAESAKEKKVGTPAWLTLAVRNTYHSLLGYRKARYTPAYSFAYLTLLTPSYTREKLPKKTNRLSPRHQQS